MHAVVIIRRHVVHPALATLADFRHPQQHVRAMREVLAARRPVPVLVPGARVAGQVRDFVLSGLVRPVTPMVVCGEFGGFGAEAGLG